MKRKARIGQRRMGYAHSIVVDDIYRRFVAAAFSMYQSSILDLNLKPDPQ
jgi:hypothetical protein